MSPLPKAAVIPHLRIARPVSDLGCIRRMYCTGLGLTVLGSFENHAGFDGVILGEGGAGYHFEFTRCLGHPVNPRPTEEDLVIFYLPDGEAWRCACERMLAAGFGRVASFNPYWDARGCTFEDADGYRIVLQNAAWSNVEAK